LQTSEQRGGTSRAGKKARKEKRETRKKGGFLRMGFKGKPKKWGARKKHVGGGGVWKKKDK